MLFAKTNHARGEQYEALRQVTMRQPSNVNEERYTTAHDGIALFLDIALPTIVSEGNPVRMPADHRNEVRVERVRRKVGAVPLDAIARCFEGVGNAFSQVAVREERELMLRIRKRELPSTRRGRVRSPR